MFLPTQEMAELIKCLRVSTTYIAVQVQLFKMLWILNLHVLVVVLEIFLASYVELSYTYSMHTTTKTSFQLDFFKMNAAKKKP